MAEGKPDVIRQQLLGTRFGNRTDPSSARPVPVEVGADGALKVLPRRGRWRKIASAVLGSSSTTILTAPRAYEEVLIRVSSVDTAMRSFRLYVRIGGAAEADGNNEAKDLGIAPGDSREFKVGLGEGDVVSGQCDTASKLTCSVYAIEER